ncbi:MAG: hypothetical protein KC478_08180 [Bacteriovoracaceae bacterium]|nr:hypothetical protein [Bacteriovoracaceae bacterium]
MKKIVLPLLLLGIANVGVMAESAKAGSKDVIENPTLKTLSGALNKWSLYSTFTYSGGSIEEPLSPERPNIQNAEESAGLVNMSGNVGIKYRLTKQDNLSMQVGIYSTTPFHSSIDTDNAKNQKDFDENHQDIDADDPTLSYFRTYYIGSLQNVTFLKYQHVTRGIYRDYGLHSGFSISHAAAYKINKAAYIAASLTYENYQYDKSKTTYSGVERSLLPYQTEHKFRGNISGELYVRRNVSFRFITDIFSYYQMKKETKIEDRVLQQTLAMTYFFNRDISIAPNIRFIADDLRPERTNVGLTLNVNI